MTTILKYEWISLLRNRILLGAMGLIFLAGIYAIYYGNTEMTKQKATIQLVQDAEKEKITKQKSDFKEPSFEVSWRTQRTLVNPPQSLAAFTIGQRDVFPFTKTIRAYGLYGSIFGSEIANPFKLLTGNFDLAFVFIFLLPLLIIALSYNLLSAEQEQGTLSLILVNEISLSKLIFQKLIFRVLVVLGFVILLFLVGIVWTSTPLNLRSIVWLIGTCLYILFWFSLVFFWVSYRQSSSFNALALLGSWLLFVVIIPTFLNLYLESTRPLTSGANLQRELREITEAGWNVPKKENLKKYFLENGIIDTTKISADMVHEIALVHYMDKNAAPHFAEYKTQLNERVNLSRSMSWLSPATQTQSLLNQLANVDTDAYLRFLESLESYYPKFKGFFDSQKLANKKFDKNDFDKIPMPTFKQNESKIIWTEFLPIGIFIMLFFGLGWRKMNQKIFSL